MQTLNVDLGSRSYPIFIGNQLLGRPELVTPYVTGKQVMLISNEVVAPLYLDRVREAFSAFRCETLVLPDGEATKNLVTLNLIFDALLEKRFERRCTLVALGGGVTGDLVGFAAACYQRGVDFIQIPTTLLAQVDSSVGGKTGVNHALGKNMIGAFHQPRCVIADTDCLGTLEDRQLSAGLAEVIKYGLITDPGFFEWLEQNMLKLLSRDAGALAHAIDRSCQLKAAVVAEDERESGRRAILNYGHTFGHAIEAALGYGKWLHGEAVGTGMLLAADLSARMGMLSAVDVQRIENIIDAARLPTRAPAQMDYATFMRYMAVDKKVDAGNIRLILLQALGQALIASDYDPGLLQTTIEAHHAIQEA